MSTPSYKHFGNYSGYVIYGTEKIVESPIFDKTKHLHRVLLLLSSGIESSTWGTVQSYDGAGISAGLLHHVATLPEKATRGGTFWALMQEFQDLGLPRLAGVEMKEGLPYDAVTKLPLLGDDIRKLFTGSYKGLTPQPPPPGVLERVQLVHDLFANPLTRGAQLAAARKWLNSVCSYPELAGALEPGTPSAPSGLKTSDFLSPELELACCVIRSFAVNNPAAAHSAIKQSLPVDAEFPLRVYDSLQRIRAPWVKRYEATLQAVDSFGFTFSRKGLDQMRKAKI